MYFIFLSAIMIYRAFRNNRKRRLKVAHMLIHVIAFILVVIGLVAVFDSHNLKNPPIPNLYTLHSWIGLSAVILFACQVRFCLSFWISIGHSSEPTVKNKNLIFKYKRWNSFVITHSVTGCRMNGQGQFLVMREIFLFCNHDHLYPI